eukprot:Mrub_13822.p2 GENE.Mrub_13822~~Mrub_13822.p2  ORF type:complete len:128 (-),score=9.85 Mrub_13822:91-474(-)
MNNYISILIGDKIDNPIKPIDEINTIYAPYFLSSGCFDYPMFYKNLPAMYKPPNKIVNFGYCKPAINVAGVTYTSLSISLYNIRFADAILNQSFYASFLLYYPSPESGYPNIEGLGSFSWKFCSKND